MNIKETKVYKYRWFIGGGILLIFVGWLVLREVRSLQAESKAERELLLRQRKEAEARLEERHQEELRRSDSAYMELLGIKTKVEYKIIEREKWITKFIETASVAARFKYVDSVLGPK